MRRRSEPLTHVVQTPFFPFNRFRCKLEIRPAPVAEPSTDCSPARSGGLLSAPPCSPSPAPPKSAPGGCLSDTKQPCDNMIRYTIGFNVCGILICMKRREPQRGRRSRQRADPARRPSRPSLRPTSGQPLRLPLHPPILPGCRAAPGIAGP